MRRREYLAGSIAFVGSLAGCTEVLDGFDDSESGDDRGPAVTVEAYYEAALEGDADAAQSFFHSDATIRPSDEYFAQVQQSSLQIETTTVIEENDEEATVEATLSREIENGERVRNFLDFLLQRVDGEWKIYHMPGAATPGPAVPQAQWDVTERTAGGAVTAVVFEHSGGETVDSSTLSSNFAGYTVDSPGTASDVTAGTSVVVPFDDEGTVLSSGTTVGLTWADPEGGRWRNLASVTLTNDTAGSPADQLLLE